MSHGDAPALSTVPQGSHSGSTAALVTIVHRFNGGSCVNEAKQGEELRTRGASPPSPP
jgi:hypothetical protein